MRWRGFHLNNFWSQNMKHFKSGKLRRLELRQARLRRHAKRQRMENTQKLQSLSYGVAPVDVAQLRPNNSYGQPDFVVRGFYVDQPFTCVDCGTECVWIAARQKWWYEMAKGDVFSTAIRCATCRAKERQRKDEARLRWKAGLLRKQQGAAFVPDKQDGKC